MELLSTKYSYNTVNVFLDVAVRHLKLSYIEVDLGRKELQERILEKIATTGKTYIKPKKPVSTACLKRPTSLQIYFTILDVLASIPSVVIQLKLIRAKIKQH